MDKIERLKADMAEAEAAIASTFQERSDADKRHRAAKKKAEDCRKELVSALMNTGSSSQAEQPAKKK